MGGNYFEFRQGVFCIDTENCIMDTIHTTHVITSHGYFVPLHVSAPAKGHRQVVTKQGITARYSVLQCVNPNTTGSHNSFF
jgi:hypothetical protein